MNTLTVHTKDGTTEYVTKADYERDRAAVHRYKDDIIRNLRIDVERAEQRADMYAAAATTLQQRFDDINEQLQAQYCVAGELRVERNKLKDTLTPAVPAHTHKAEDIQTPHDYDLF